MPKSKLGQERKLQRGDKVDIIYIVANNYPMVDKFYPDQKLLDNRKLKCLKIFVDPINMKEQLSQGFRYHAPHTRIYVLMHGGISDTEEFWLNLGGEQFMAAVEFIRIINDMTVYPVHISFISCHSGFLLQASIKDNFLSHFRNGLKEESTPLKMNSTVTVTGMSESTPEVFIPRVKCEIEEMKKFLNDENYTIQELIRNLFIKGIFCSPAESQLLRITADGAKHLNVSSIAEPLTEKELSEYVIKQVARVDSFFNDMSPLPKDIFLFFQKIKLEFVNHLFFLHFSRLFLPKPNNSAVYIDRYLIKKGDPNIRSLLPGTENLTPVMIASGQNSVEWLKKFVDHGADIHAVSRDGRTAFYIATNMGHMSIMEYFLSINVNVNQQDLYGETPLYTAVYVQISEEMVDLLCRHGANPNIKTKKGGAPLIAAAYHGDYNIVLKLLECGAKVDIKNNFGNTPLSIATDPKIISLLRNAQVSENSPEECHIESLDIESPPQDNPASSSLIAGATVGFWQESKPIELQLAHDNLDAKPSQEAQAEIEPHLNSNFDSQLMLWAVLGKIAGDVIAWSIQWWNGETKQPVEEYISAEERTLFIESNEEQLTALYQELPKLPYYDYNAFMLAELKYDLDDLKSSAITMRELKQFEKEMADFKQELIEEKEIRQAKKKASGYKHREGQSKQNFFQSTPLLLGSDSWCSAQEFQLPSTAQSYLTGSNATLV